MAPSSTKSPAPARDYPGALVVPQQRATHDPATTEMSKIKRVITALCHETIFTPHESYFWFISDRLMYLFDGVPNSTSHESKKPSNSSSFLYNCISHHPTTKTSHPPKEFLHQNKIMSTFFFAVFLRLQVQPVEEYSNDDAILQFLRRNLGDGFATKKPMPKENMNSNKSSPTKNGGVFFRWWFSSHKIPIYQQKITNAKQTHPSEEILLEEFIQTKHSLPDSWKWRMGPCKTGKREAYRNEIPPTKNWRIYLPPPLGDVDWNLCKHLPPKWWWFWNRDLRIYHGDPWGISTKIHPKKTQKEIQDTVGR